MIKSRRMRQTGHVYKILVGKTEGKRQLGRSRRRWKRDNKIDLREIAEAGIEWIHLARDRDKWGALVNTVMNSNFIHSGSSH
jgi:hypothetical protein